MKSVGYHMRKASETKMILGPLCAEFDLMKHCLEKSFLNSILRHFLKSVIDCLLAFFDIFKLYTLNTHRKSCFFCCMIIASTWAEVWCNTCLNDLLIEGRVGAIKKQSR